MKILRAINRHYPILLTRSFGQDWLEQNKKEEKEFNFQNLIIFQNILFQF